MGNQPETINRDGMYRALFVGVFSSENSDWMVGVYVCACLLRTPVQMK